ncbi:MAG: DUF2130 domain-containing protein [Chromatiaceae bacterium]|jgi:hypothetical protein|nr:DUF2130 domain-containing protein [Chromatiaceae bacterium]
MTDTRIRCPNCGYQIPISEALSAQIRGELETAVKADHEARMRQAVAQAEARARGTLDVELADLKAQLAERAEQAEQAAARELELRRQARERAAQQQAEAERIRAEVEQRLRQESAERIAQAAAAAEVRAREESALALQALQADLAAQREQVRLAQAAELSLRQEKTALEERARALDLEIARRLDAAKGELETAIRQAAAEEQELKLKEKEKTITDLRQALDAAKRRSELGSQELQGEVLELDIQARLERQFPADRIEPVAKGARGADIQQRVRNERLEDCGLILWETKNAKNWAPAWIDKLKQDQRAAGAVAAVLVSAALPEGVAGFARIDGVWVADLKTWPGVALALREQLIAVGYARAASAGQNEKMALLYDYLAGTEFRQRVEAIVEAFEAMQLQLNRERRAMEKQWAEREKQIARVIASTSAMYGALQGIVGAGLPAIPALELDETPLLGDRSEA